MTQSTNDQKSKILSLPTSEYTQDRVQVSTPPRRVPTLYPTSPPAGRPLSDEKQPQTGYKPVAHSMRPKTAPVTIESLREHRNAIALTHEESAEQSLYDLFEVEPDVSEEELRRAYKRMWACFHPDHFSAYGLYSRVQLETLLNQLREGFELLMDPQKREVYNQTLYPDGLPQSRLKAKLQSSLSLNLQPLISVSEAQSFWYDLQRNGLLGQRLKHLREHFNVSLTAVHERSKISISVLNFIENDDFESLPAPIYLKGFIKELLGLYSLEGLVDLDHYINLYSDYKSRSQN